MLDNKLLLSIIIPVYNVERYLRECLDSILGQTDSGIEIILVEDGSTDSSREICEKYVKEYRNIKLITQKNKGSGPARNIGFANSNGEYIWYVDSDDYIVRGAIYKIKKELKNNLDILLFSAISFCDGSDIITDYNRKKNLNKIMSGKKYLEVSFRDKEYIASPCLRVYKRELLEKNELYFGNERIYEDEFFSFMTLFYAERVKVTNLKLYRRRYRQGSKMVEAFSYNIANFKKIYKGYGNTVFKLLDVYDYLSKSDGNSKILLMPISSYYIAIVSYYSMLKSSSSRNMKYMLDRLNERLKPYRRYLSFKARVIMQYQTAFMIYKKTKEIVKKL